MSDGNNNMQNQQEAEAEIFAEKLRDDLQGIVNFISTQYITVTKSIGNMEVYDDKFENLKRSLLHADPDATENKGKATMSLLATKKGILSSIDKKIAANKDNTDNKTSYENIKREIIQEIEKKETKLNEQLSSTDGILEVIGEKYQRELIFDGSSMLLKDSSTFLDATQKQEILKKLYPQCYDGTFEDHYIKDLMFKGNVYEENVKSTKELFKKYFSRKVPKYTKIKNYFFGRDTFYMFDSAKLDDNKNIESFIKEFKQLQIKLQKSKLDVDFNRNSTKSIASTDSNVTSDLASSRPSSINSSDRKSVNDHVLNNKNNNKLETFNSKIKELIKSVGALNEKLKNDNQIGATGATGATVAKSGGSDKDSIKM